MSGIEHDLVDPDGDADDLPDDFYASLDDPSPLPVNDAPTTTRKRTAAPAAKRSKLTKTTTATPLRVVGPGDDTRPTIQLGPDLHRVVAQAIEAIGGDPNVYQRDGVLVDLVRVDGGTPRIRALTTPTIRVRLTANAAWQVFNMRVDGYVPTIPTDPVVRGVEDAGTYPGVRALVGVTGTPIVRSDGSICQNPGFDAATGYVYVPSTVYPTVPSTPTAATVAAAREAILETVCDFPFAGPEHRSAWLAYLLTILCRPAIAGPSPMWGVSGTTAGAGKGKLVDVAGVLATGAAPSRRPWSPDPNETRKVLQSVLLDGDPLTLFDNVAVIVQAPALEAVLTSSTYRDRVLGTSQSMSATVTTTIALTGNGLTYGGDLGRRVIPIELESPLERPEERSDLRHENLIGWVIEHRARLVVAALTCIRGWYAAGAPDMGVKPLGSYEGWSRVVPAIVRWLGLTCPLKARRGLADLDATRGAHEALIAGWSRLQGDTAGVTAAVAIRTLYPPPTREERAPEPAYYGELRDAIESVTESSRPTARALGNSLRPFRRRVVGGRMLDARVVAGSMSWRVVRAQGSAPCSSTSAGQVDVDAGVVDVDGGATGSQGAE